ncbi:hypothetical protein [Hyphomonas sp.]|uniref:hypothetical protein n=1 Tax=Hyphomonas sp. TaxID=87 RepID=UPI0025BECA31|nr:hypothetical protein [Hyphomonas sp.]
MTSLLPAAWDETARMLVVGLAGALILVLAVVLVARLAGGRGAKGPLAAEGAVTGALSDGPAMVMLAQVASGPARAPDLDPDEWVSGNVIHLDRQRAVGLIRCDRVKSPVQFRLAPGRAHVRVGQKVRFKGRHGARRRPVADVVERAG